MRQEQYIADLGAMVLTGLGKEERIPYENLEIHSYIKVEFIGFCILYDTN